MSSTILPEGYRQLKLWGGNCSASDAVEAHFAGEVLAANALGIAAGDIYFTAKQKSVEDIRRVIGKCRIVADSLEELYWIDQAVQNHLRSGVLEPVGIRLALDGQEGQGLAPCSLPTISRELRKLPAISVRGCFVQGKAAGLHGEALGHYFRDCYEAAKRMSAVFPCGIAFLCVTDGGEAARRNAEDHPETFTDFLRAAGIVAAQNQSAFYAKLLVT